jgi:hypothetical protein
MFHVEYSATWGTLGERADTGLSQLSIFIRPPIGCLDVRRSEDGIIERYRIKSTVYKRRDVRGQPRMAVHIFFAGTIRANL